MTQLREFLLPDVGEGLTEAEIVRWHVAPGDTVAVNQVVVEIETAKSVVELPSPYAGRVSRLHAEEGRTVNVGSVIISIDTSAAEEDPAEADRPDPPTSTPALLVGYGPRADERVRRRAAGVAPAPPPGVPSARALAKPPVRKLAKDLAIDIASLADPAGGVVTRDQVLAAARARDEDTSVTRTPVRGVRKHMAAAMVRSAFTAPHVTEFVSVDVTDTMRLRHKLSARPEFRDVRLSPLAFVARAVLRSVAATPEVNSRWDEDGQEIVRHHDVNLGIAVATPRGLIVPNVKRAQALSFRDLVSAIAAVAAEARAGRADRTALTGGTLTITNIGVFGIDTGTPITNPGEAAILAVGATRRTPWVVADDEGERIAIRDVLQLALSFDHRVLDGAQGSRFLADVAALLRDPDLAIL